MAEEDNKGKAVSDKHLSVMAEEDNIGKAVSDKQCEQPIPCPLPGSGEWKSWPELVGLPGEEAKRKIEEEMPGVNAYLVPPNPGATRDLRSDRVRIFVDSSGKVRQPPAIG